MRTRPSRCPEGRDLEEVRGARAGLAAADPPAVAPVGVARATGAPVARAAALAVEAPESREWSWTP
jgi:hypothetical protein